MQTVFSFSEVAQSLGFPTAAAAYVARKRGLFPVRVRRIGGKLICFKSDYDEYLATGDSQAHLSVPTIKRALMNKAGRPTKRESINAVAAGLTVRELRSQSAGV